MFVYIVYDIYNIYNIFTIHMIIVYIVSTLYLYIDTIGYKLDSLDIQLGNLCDRLYGGRESIPQMLKAWDEIHRTGSYFWFASNPILSFKFLLILIFRSVAVIHSYVINNDARVYRIKLTLHLFFICNSYRDVPNTSQTGEL